MVSVITDDLYTFFFFFFYRNQDFYKNDYRDASSHKRELSNKGYGKQQFWLQTRSLTPQLGGSRWFPWRQCRWQRGGGAAGFWEGMTRGGKGRWWACRPRRTEGRTSCSPPLCRSEAPPPEWRPNDQCFSLPSPRAHCPPVGKWSRGSRSDSQEMKRWVFFWFFSTVW